MKFRFWVVSTILKDGKHEVDRAEFPEPREELDAVRAHLNHLWGKHGDDVMGADVVATPIEGHFRK